jgi:peptidoglycan-associated lipoprotein
MQLAKSFFTISLITIFIFSCSTVQVTEESVRESSIATVEVSTSDTFETKTTVVSTSATIYFDYDKYNLTSRSIQTLRGVISAMNDNESLTLVVEGHADERGTREYNLALGQRRAESVADYLESRGVNRSRLVIKSYGEEMPAISASNENAWSKNRRVEIK